MTKFLLVAITLVAPLTMANAADTGSSTTAPAAPAAQTAPAATNDAAKAAQTVEGPIAKVVARKKEIYVQGTDKKHEFYFKPHTVLMKDGKPAEFSTLTEGMKVRVTYETVGKRTDPLKVEVLQ